MQLNTVQLNAVQLNAVQLNAVQPARTGIIIDRRAGGLLSPARALSR